MIVDAEQRRGQLNLHPRPSNDPNDPLNWSSLRKNVNFFLACLYLTLGNTVVCIAPVVYGQVHDELGLSFQELNQAYAISYAALGLGGFLFIPFALLFGRRPVYLVSISTLLGATIWQARMQNVGDLYAFNVMSGLGGSINTTLATMTMADLYFVHQRGSRTNMLGIAINAGVFLAPVAAGYSATSQGWRS